MSLNLVDYHGVHMIGPENFMCAILRSPEDGKILPIWISIVEGSNLAAREQGEDPRRPDTHDLLADVLSRQEGDTPTIAITSHHEGVFVATITQGGEEFDSRTSDALVLSQILDIPILVDEDVWSQSAMFLSDEDLAQYLDVDVDEPAEQDLLAETDVDADFQKMMQSLGIAEETQEEDSEGDDEKRNPEEDPEEDPDN
jgi:hypothetical protein